MPYGTEVIPWTPQLQCFQVFDKIIKSKTCKTGGKEPQARKVGPKWRGGWEREGVNSPNISLTPSARPSTGLEQPSSSLSHELPAEFPIPFLGGRASSRRRHIPVIRKKGKTPGPRHTTVKTLLKFFMSNNVGTPCM
jgi:hypothetical protein